MTKSRERPMAGASRRSSRAHIAWKVEIHAPRRRVAEQRLDALPHLLGRLVGEGDRDHLAGVRVAVADEVRDAVGDDARLAGPGAGEDQQRAVHLEHGLALFGVQLVEEVHHRTADSIQSDSWTAEDRGDVQAEVNTAGLARHCRSCRCLACLF